jgi:hypothetical protein
MPTVPLYELRSGTVIEYDGGNWLVLSGGMVPFPHGFYPPYLFTLQPLPSGSIREIRLFGGLDYPELMTTDERLL